MDAEDERNARRLRLVDERARVDENTYIDFNVSYEILRDTCRIRFLSFLLESQV